MIVCELITWFPRFGLSISVCVPIEEGSSAVKFYVFLNSLHVLKATGLFSLSRTFPAGKLYSSLDRNFLVASQIMFPVHRLSLKR